MARLPETLSTHALPLWDTFEVVFFLMAGVFLGIVVGVMFPSLWRTLRRRFRKPQSRDYLDTSSLLVFDASRIETLSEGGKDLSLDSLEKKELQEIFFNARYLFSKNAFREAIKTYTELLASAYISKHQTHAALFELSQCYFFLGLFGKSLEITTELCHRLPSNSKALQFAVRAACAEGQWKPLEKILEKYTGPRSPELRIFVSLSLLSLTKQMTKKNKDSSDEQLVLLLNKSLRWNESNQQARICLWQVFSQRTWDQSPKDPLTLCGLIFEDFFAFSSLRKGTELSAYSVSEAIAGRLLKLAQARPLQLHFAQAKSEFLDNNEKDLLELFPTHSHAVEAQSQFFFAALLKIDPKDRKEHFTVLQSIAAALLLNPQLAHLASCQPLWSSGARLSSALHKCSNCHGLFEEFSWDCPGCKTHLGLTLPGRQIFVEELPPSL